MRRGLISWGFCVLVAGCGEPTTNSGRLAVLLRVAEHGASMKVRADACGEIASLGDSAAIPHLIRFLRDPVLQSEASRGLGKLKAVQARAALEEVLLSTSGLNKEAVWALGEIGDSASVGSLKRALASLEGGYVADTTAIGSALAKVQRSR